MTWSRTRTRYRGHPARAEVVMADVITGTVRHPFQTTSEFLPISPLWTRDWLDSRRRILDAQERCVAFPRVELLKLGDGYFVVDGHKRVAAARRLGAAVDASVVELRPNAF